MINTVQNRATTRRFSFRKSTKSKSKTEAKQFVHGTLKPFFTLSNVARVLGSSYSYESAFDFLSSFPVKTVGPRKQAIANLVASNECTNVVKFVLAEKFLQKCSRSLKELQKSLSDSDGTVGVRVPNVGTFTE
ncbi:hypothetical protein GQ600_258 [Phytophthora cactorum]|nr:hypothetical protein GQ600_258 [Phytophthora cactorum]